MCLSSCPPSSCLPSFQSSRLSRACFHLLLCCEHVTTTSLETFFGAQTELPGSPRARAQIHIVLIKSCCFRPQCKLWLSANHRPAIRDTSHAMWRRVRLIPFAVTIPPEERVKDLAEQLQAEADGILSWMVSGAVEWKRFGLGDPESVTEATA